jgi:phage FluMu protein gp41
MAEFTVALLVGITIGSITHKEAVMRDATVQDMFDATAESERLVNAQVAIDNNGAPVYEPRLVVSPTACGINTLRRQIVKIGALEGPFDMIMLNKLSPMDINTLQDAITQRETAALQAVAQRGRPDGTEPGAET